MFHNSIKKFWQVVLKKYSKSKLFFIIWSDSKLLKIDSNQRLSPYALLRRISQNGKRMKTDLSHAIQWKDKRKWERDQCEQKNHLTGSVWPLNGPQSKMWEEEIVLPYLRSPLNNQCSHLWHSNLKVHHQGTAEAQVLFLPAQTMTGFIFHSSCRHCEVWQQQIHPQLLAKRWSLGRDGIPNITFFLFAMHAYVIYRIVRPSVLSSSPDKLKWLLSFHKCVQYLMWYWLYVINI